MIKNNQQNRYSLNVFLNEYFNVIVFLVMIVIFITAYFLLLNPKFQATQTVIKDNIEMQKKLYAEEAKQLRDLKTIKEIYDKIPVADLKKFDGILPDAYIKEKLFGEMEEIIIESGFLLKTITVSTDEETEAETVAEAPTIGSGLETERIGKIMLKVSIGAIDYSGFKSLLKTLEANSRLFDIELVSFSQGDNSAELQFVTYYYKARK